MGNIGTISLRALDVLFDADSNCLSGRCLQELWDIEPYQSGVDAILEHLRKRIDERDVFYLSYPQFREKVECLNRILSKNQETIDRIFGERLQIRPHRNLENHTLEVPKTETERALMTISFPFRLLIVMISEFFIAIFMAISSLGARLNFDPINPVRGKPGILLLHGFHHNQTGWIVGRRLLARENFENLYSMNYANVLSNDNHDRMEDYAEKVAKKVQQIREETGQDKVIMVCHSMGGLVAAEAARRDPRLQKIITIGTPWKGAPLASIAPLGEYVAKQMQTDSSYLHALRFDTECAVLSGQIDLTTIRSSLDHLVPHTRATIEGARRKEFFTLGHLGYLVDPRVWREVKSELHRMLD